MNRRCFAMMCLLTAAGTVPTGGTHVMAQDGTQGLLKAAEAGNVAEVRRLLKAGVHVDVRDNRRRTPLMIAVQRSDAALARVLVEAGADINAQDNIKDSPFLLAGARGDVPILKLLIPKGPDYSKVNRYGGSALIPAAERSRPQPFPHRRRGGAASRRPARSGLSKDQGHPGGAQDCLLSYQR